MTKILGAAALLLFFGIPAQAQSGIYGGSLNGGAQPLPVYPTLSVGVTYATGSPDFVPSNFLSYQQAVTMGNEMLAESSKTLGQVARESRHEEKPKAKLVIVQDNSGELVIAKSR